MDNDDESTLNLTVTLHSTTQTRCIILPKATDNALTTLCNVFCPFFRSFTIVSLQCCPESNTRANQHIQEKTRLHTHKPKHSIEHTPTLNIVHIGTAS